MNEGRREQYQYLGRWLYRGSTVLTTEAAMLSHTVIIHAYGRHLNNFFINIIIITAKFT